MSELIKRLQQLADQLAAEGETDAPTDIALAVEQVEHLQAEEERLSNEVRAKQMDYDAMLRIAMRTEGERDQLKAHLQRFMEVESDQVTLRVAVQTAQDATPEICLIAHDAEVIRTFAKSLHRPEGGWNIIGVREIEAYAQQLEKGSIKQPTDQPATAANLEDFPPLLNGGNRPVFMDYALDSIEGEVTTTNSMTVYLEPNKDFDMSGRRPGRTFASVTITRAELREMLKCLDDDIAQVRKHCPESQFE